MLADDAADASSLLGETVLHRGLRLGRVMDVLLSADLARVLGLEVETLGQYRVFLPASTWERSESGIEVPLPLSVLSEYELRYYEGSGRRLRELLAGADRQEEARPSRLSAAPRG